MRAGRPRGRLGAAGKLTCAYQPQNQVERFNRTLLDEWAYLRRPYTSNNERSAALADFLHAYNNHHRCHTALGGHPPSAV